VVWINPSSGKINIKADGMKRIEISIGARANNFLNDMSGIKYFGEAIANAFYNYYGSFDKSLTITSPNGTETFTSGEVTVLSWTSIGTFANVRIDCSTDGGASWQNLVSSTANDGSESIILPSDNSDNCLIRISDVNAMGIVDESDAIFTIGTPPVSTIEVTYPNGGETFEANYYETITWTNTGTVSKVNIEFSSDVGATWKRMAYAVTNNNSYIINIPGVSTSQCLVRVTNAENLGINDISDNTLNIQLQSFPSIEVMYPNGGETITPGATETITWTSSGFTSDVGISISTDEGANWTEIISSTANDGTEDITMPSVYSERCLIWIYEATPDIYIGQPCALPLDVSDNLFRLDTMSVDINLDLSKTDNIELYPNPSSGKINIKADGMKRIEISNINGQTVYELNKENSFLEIDLSDKPKGIYIIKITSDKATTSRKIIKQ